MSVIFRGIIDDSGIEDPIPCTISKPILDRVIVFLRHHKENTCPEIARPLSTGNFSEIVPQWFADYSEMEQDTLFEVIQAANYLDIQPLLKLLCAKVASIIFDMNNDQIKEYFGIETDLSEEQIQNIREEVAWAEEALP